MTDVVLKPWGSELWWAHVDGAYLGKILTIEPDRRLSLHYHAVKRESMRVMSGQGVLTLGPDVDHLEERRIYAGDSFDVPAGWPHRIASTPRSSLVVIEISTDDPDDVIRLADDYARDSTPREIQPPRRQTEPTRVPQPTT